MSSIAFEQEMATLGAAAYGNALLVPSGWRVLTPADLTDPNLVINNSSVSWSFSDTGGFTNGKAFAFAAVNGDDLVISFRGSDGALAPDYESVLVHQGDDQYADLLLFIQDVLEYAGNISENGGHAYSVHLTGHSLGGTLAELTATHISEGDLDFAGSVDVHTIGSPGVGWDRGYYLSADQGLSFIHTQDPVATIAPTIAFTRRFTSDIVVERLDLSWRSDPDFEGVFFATEHKTQHYLESIDIIARSELTVESCERSGAIPIPCRHWQRRGHGRRYLSGAD
jgi:hypothetical protein